jgi:pimeloyl-ACP methyl ester carboxylesterase
MSKDHLLLLHGALGAKSQFTFLIPLLENKFHIHALDFEGHGSSPMRKRPFKEVHFAENVMEYLDEISLSHVNIFGYSMGGKVGHFARMLEEMHAASGWRNILQKTKEMMLTIVTESSPTIGEMDQIRQEVRVTVGDKDNLVSIEETVKAYRSLPKGQLQIFPKTPHPIEKVPLAHLAHSLVEFFNG